MSVISYKNSFGMKFGGYTRESMIDQLMVGDNFLESEAEYAADALGL